MRKMWFGWQLGKKGVKLRLRNQQDLLSFNHSIKDVIWTLNDSETETQIFYK